MKNCKKGFTLIELVVVMAVLSVLAMIIVPYLLNYRQDARNSVAVANAKTCYVTGVSAKTFNPEIDSQDDLNKFAIEILGESLDCQYEFNAEKNVESATWLYEDGTGALYFRDGSHSFVE